MRRHHRLADAGGGFVAHHHCAQELVAGGAAALCCGERGGDGRAAGVIARIAMNVVEFHRVRGRAVDQCRGTHGGAASAREPRLAAIQVVGKRLLQQRGRCHQAARQHRRVPVDYRALGVVDDVGGQLRGLFTDGVVGELLHQHGGSPVFGLQ